MKQLCRHQGQRRRRGRRCSRRWSRAPSTAPPAVVQLWAVPATCQPPHVPAACLWLQAAPLPSTRQPSLLAPTQHSTLVPPTQTPWTPLAPPPHSGLSPTPTGQSCSPAHLLRQCSHSPATLGNRSALPLAHSSPSTSNHPFTGRGRHHQPHCPHLGLQPRPTAGAQHKQGAITQRPQRITSSPGLHHSPVQRKSKHSQKRKGDSECLFSHACTKSRERACSRAQGPQRSPCPWDTSAVVSGAALVSPVGNG